MKAFETWTNQKPNDWDGQRKDVAKVAWKAALEHVLKNCVLPNGVISETLIKRELGSE